MPPSWWKYDGDRTDYQPGPVPDEPPRWWPLVFLAAAVAAFALIGVCAWKVLATVADVLTYP